MIQVQVDVVNVPMIPTGITNDIRIIPAPRPQPPINASDITDAPNPNNTGNSTNTDVDTTTGDTTDTDNNNNTGADNNSGPCTLTVTSPNGVDARAYAHRGTRRSSLVFDSQHAVTEQIDGSPTGTWYHVDAGWVVGSGVALSGNCNSLPTDRYVSDGTDLPPDGQDTPPPDDTVAPPPDDTTTPPPDDTVVPPPPQCNSVSITGASTSNGWQYIVNGTANCSPSIILKDWLGNDHPYPSPGAGQWSITVNLGIDADNPPPDCGKTFTIFASVGGTTARQSLTKTSCT